MPRNDEKGMEKIVARISHRFIDLDIIDSTTVGRPYLQIFYPYSLHKLLKPLIQIILMLRRTFYRIAPLKLLELFLPYRGKLCIILRT